MKPGGACSCLASSQQSRSFPRRASHRRTWALALSACLAVICLPGWALAVQAGSPTAAARIVDGIDETRLVAVAAGVHPLAQARYDKGAVPDDMALEHMYVQLRRGPEQEKALDALLERIQDPADASYHQWLTADALGTSFGPSQADVGTVVAWLGGHGLKVNLVHKSGLTIDVSGTAAQVREAFHTEIHYYDVKGVRHIANASVPQIPAALAPVLVGVVSLHDFMPKPLLKRHSAFTFPCTGCPGGFANAPQYDEGPADFATIYNTWPLLKLPTPITGKGITVVPLEDTDINPADVASFRKAFGLSLFSGTFEIVHPGTGCSDPGLNGAEGEAALDAEWGGGVAPDAHVLLASCADTATNFGAFIAAQNLLDTATPPDIMSLSYLQCEASIGPGPSGNGFVEALWQQAAVEGVSVFVAAGDNAAAGCDDFDTAAYAVGGIAANGLASTPYNVATGGTDFLDTAEGTNSTYWSNTDTWFLGSAKSYIPEMPWNDSCASSVLYTYIGYTSGLAFCNSATGAGFLDIVGGSGAPSFVYAKPSWQRGVSGVPNDGRRDLPDVSLFASNGFWSHAIVFCMSDANQGGSPCDYSVPVDVLYNSAGGTSFTAPQFASIQALIDQKAGGRQGNPNPTLYKLAKAEYSSAGGIKACNSSLGTGGSSSCIFHDVTAGNNDVPCYGTANCYGSTAADYGVLSTSDYKLEVAYPTTAGWDFATGLGSVNVANLVKAWP